MGILYIVGTPIGNLEDLSPRAARVLGQVALVAAEDTRVTLRLLRHLGIRPSMTSFHQHNYQEKLVQVLEVLSGGDVALVSDAGMPVISDPGNVLVEQARTSGFSVQVVPGPSALTAALAVSGMAGDAFDFLGFLPRRRKERQQALRAALGGERTQVIFEAPHRVRNTLEDIALVFDDRPISVCRELTKLHEEVFYGTAAEALEHFGTPRGEFVLVIQGAANVHTGDACPEDAEAAAARASALLSDLRAAGVRAKDAVAHAAHASGLPKNRVYELWVALGRESAPRK